MAKTSLPPGFRFHPTDVELTVYYLKRKLLKKRLHCDAILEIDLYKFAPWDLPDKACLQSKDLEWYFFCPRDRKYSSGSRTNRSTEDGYWKATGKDRPVIYNSRTVGMKRTLVFHRGKPPRGDRTDWVMYEYRLEDMDLSASGVQQDAYVLCKIFKKSGPGPKIGEQYGAPFNEEDWNDDENVELSSSPFVPPCPPESSNGILEAVGQHVAATDDATDDGDGEVSLDPLSKLAGKHAVNEDPRETASTSDLPFDGIPLQRLAEILNDSSMHLLSTVGHDDLLSDLTAHYEHDYGETEGIFNELDEIASSAVEDNICDHGYSCGEHVLEPMLAALENEQYLELNDLSSSPADDPYGLLPLDDPSFQYPLELQPMFQEFPNDIFDTDSGSPPPISDIDDHVT